MVEKLKNNKLMILLLVTGAVYFFLKYITPLIAPVLVAMLFVTIFGPLLQKMQTHLHIHRQAGAILLLLLAGAVVGVLASVLSSWIVGSLPNWIGNLEVLEEQLALVIHSVCESVGETIGVDSAYLEETILQRMEEGFDYLQVEVLPGMLTKSWKYVKGIVTVGAFLVTFLISTVLLAKDYDAIMNRMLDKEECHLFLEVVCGVIRYIATFVKAQLILMSIIAFVAAVVFGVAGIRHGVLWGILAGLLDVLPFVGTGIVLVPTAAVQIFTGEYVRAGVCVALYVACIFIREFLEPKLIGKRIGVSPIAVLLSLYAGIQLFGVMGIIKGPLGFIIIKQTYQGYSKRLDGTDVHNA